MQVVKMLNLISEMPSLRYMDLVRILEKSYILAIAKKHVNIEKRKGSFEMFVFIKGRYIPML